MTDCPTKPDGHEVLGKAAPIEVNDARYAPDGKSIAVTALRKNDKPGEWQSLDFEPGVIDRSTPDPGHRTPDALTGRSRCPRHSAARLVGDSVVVVQASRLRILWCGRPACPCSLEGRTTNTAAETAAPQAPAAGTAAPQKSVPDGSEILFSRPLQAGDEREGQKGTGGALRQEWGLDLWSIRPDGTGERLVTTGWSPDWR